MTFNAYRFKPTKYIPGQSSCLAISGLGGDSVVWFSEQDGKSLLTYPDMHLFQLPLVFCFILFFFSFFLFFFFGSFFSPLFQTNRQN